MFAAMLLVNLALAVLLVGVIAVCAVAYGRLRVKADAKNASDRRAYLKARARSL